MKRLLLAGVGLAIAATAALGADPLPGRPLPVPRTVSYVPFFTWNGAYVGLNAGYGFGSSQWTDTVARISTNKFSISGGLVGGTAGYNLQLSTVVVGLEGDIGWSGIKGSTTVNCLSTCETSNGWLGTARGRIGYAFDRFLPYFTGGAAFGEVKGSVLGLRQLQPDQGRLDRGRRARIRLRRQLDGQARISLCRSRQGDLQRGLLRRQSVRRHVPDQHRARRRELQVLSRRSAPRITRAGARRPFSFLEPFPLALNQLSSWPGLPRDASTALFRPTKGVDARDKRGHDGGD